MHSNTMHLWHRWPIADSSGHYLNIKVTVGAHAGWFPTFDIMTLQYREGLRCKSQGPTRCLNYKQFC